MTGIILYGSIHRTQSLVVFKYVLNIPQYWVDYQLSEGTPVLAQAPLLPSGQQRNPRQVIQSHCGKKCVCQFPLTGLVIKFHQIRQCFSISLQIRNQAEALSVHAKHEKAVLDQGFWIGHEALWGCRPGSLPAALLLLV